jgi:Fe-S oxidoreductase
MSHVAFPVVFLLVLAGFGVILAVRARLLVAAKPANRVDRIGKRIGNTLVYAFGQKKFLRGEQPAGLMHFVIFWGFVTLGLQVVTLFGRSLSSDWFFPGFAPDQPLGPPFFVVRDVLEVLVIVAVLYALYRRLIVHTPRLFGFRPAEERMTEQPHWEGILILVLILMIMVGGLLHDAGLLAAHRSSSLLSHERHWAPVTGPLAGAFDGLSAGTAKTISEAGWWMHDVAVLTFLVLIPLSKHFHIITAVPNVFFGRLEPKSAPRTIGVDGARAAGVASLSGLGDAVVSLDGFSWKQILDMYSCTECGRCTSACPATASGTALAPRQLILDLRDYAYGHRTLDGDKIVSNDVLWSCTTCMACVEACPVGIEHVPTIVQMRRGLVERGEMEPMLQQTLENFMKQGNSYGKSGRMRARWTQGLEFEIPDARKEPVRYLWFVGDFASFDERSQAASRRVARILHDAGVSFGLLYEAERNAGNDVRRIGEEGLFELLVEQNMEAFASAGFEAIFTTDPHSLNTLRNEYPDYGLDRPVYHYTELLTELIRSGELQPQEPLAGVRVTYHDPCYLGRYNRITEAPRELMRAAGVTLVEMPRHGTNTFCCGAGGGRIWMDDSKLAERPSEQRIREAQALGGLDYFVVSCPKDLAMYSDAAATVGADFQVIEITELLERAIAADRELAEAAAPEPA